MSNTKTKTARQQYYQDNKEYWRLKGREKRDKNRQYVAQIKQGWVCKCGESDPCCVDFHHRDQSKKEFTIQRAIMNCGLETLKAEIAKCDMLCANCHRKLHAKIGYGNPNTPVKLVID